MPSNKTRTSKLEELRLEVMGLSPTLSSDKALSHFTIDDQGSVLELLPVKLGFEGVDILGFGGYATVFVGCAGSLVSRKIFSEMIPIEDHILQKYILSDHPEAIALKCSEITSGDANKLRSFQREVEALKGLDHPKVCKFLASFALSCTTNEQGQKCFSLVERPMSPPGANDLFYCVTMMEKLGPSLSDIIIELGLSNLEEEEILHVFIEVGKALAYLHTHLMTHNDLHQGNIVTTFIGDCFDRKAIFTSPMKLIDFGMAKVNSLEQVQQAQINSSNAIAQWRNEIDFVDRKIAQPPSVKNPYLKMGFDLGRLLAKASIHMGMRKFQFNCTDLLKTFQQETIIKSPKLRKAIMLLVTLDESQRITVEDALLIVQGDRA